jgi:hypothetical protein
VRYYYLINNLQEVVDVRRNLMITSVLFLIPSFVFADSLAKKWGIGVNWPGVSVKYGINAKNAVELKSQFGEDIFVIGPRYYRILSSKGETDLYVGGEIDYVSFEGDVSEGIGYVVAGFVGGEHFINPNFGVSLDIGPVLISLTDSDTDKTEIGVDIVLNIGLTYYFVRRR